MGFTGTKLETIGPVFVDWAKSFEKGFDTKAAEDYLKLKNDQYILDRQSKPEIPETPLDGLNDNGALTTRFTDMRARYDELADIRKKYPSARDKHIDATKEMNNIIKEMNNVEEVFGLIETASLEHAADPTQFPGDMMMGPSVEHEIYLDIVNGNFGEGSEISKIEFEDNTIKFVSRSTGEKYAWTDLRKPEGNPKLIDAFDNKLLDPDSGLVAKAIAGDAEKVNSLGAEVQHTIREIGRTSYNDLFPLLMGQHFTHFTVEGKDGRQGTPDDLKSFQVSATDSDLYAQYFKNTFSNWDEFISIDTNGGVTPLKKEVDWKKWANPKYAARMGLKLEEGKNASFIKSQVTDFLTEYWGNNVTQMARAAEVMKNKKDQEEKNIIKDPLNLNRTGLNSNEYTRRRKIVAGEGFLQNVQTEAEEIFRNKYPDLTFDVDSPEFKKEFGEVFVSKINSFNVANRKYDPKRIFTSVSDARLSAFRLMDAETVENMIKRNYKNYESNVNYINFSEILAAEDGIPVDNKLEAGINNLVDRFIGIQDLAKNQEIKKVGHYVGSDNRYKAGVRIVMNEGNELKEIANSLNINLEGLKSWKALTETTYTGDALKQNQEKIKNQFKEVVKELRTAFWQERMSRDVAYKNPDMILTYDDDGVTQFQGISIFGGRGLEVDEISGKNVLNLGFMGGIQLDAYGQDIMDERYFLHLTN